MEQLFESLGQIIQCLNQIYTITQNQTTVLLDGEHQRESLDLIEEMASYKNEVTLELECIEQQFQVQYDTYKGAITAAEDQQQLQQAVAQVLALKDKVIELEQQNVFIMQELLKRLAEKIELPKNPAQVSVAYKQYSKQ